ncbi:MAG: DNA polymerase ligase N-terminal domain-containing protein [Pirellulales bacterium]
MPRFVVLHHELPANSGRSSHWDLMFEVGDVLVTFALPQPPGELPEQLVDALADHRPEYLSYEGPVSGGRGEVTRWDEGSYETVSRSEDAWEVRLTGRRTPERAVITQGAASPGKRVIRWGEGR